MKIFRRKSVSQQSPPPSKPVVPTKTLIRDDNHDIFVIYEHERRRKDLGWSYRNLEAGDPKRFGSSDGSWQSEIFVDPVHLIPSGWHFQGKWQVDKKVDGADGDWLYAYDFRVLQKLDKSGSAGPAPSQSEMFVRRKKWVRQLIRSADDDEENFLRDDVSMISDMDARHMSFSSTTASLTPNGKDEMGKFDYSDDDDDDGRASVISAVPSTTSSLPNTPVKTGVANNYNSVIRCPELSAIGKQMKLLEASCRKQQEAKREEWKTSIAPGYKAQVKELEKRIDTLKKRLVVEAGMGIGVEHLSVLEEELKTHTQVYENFKRQLYFPNSTIALGENGVYFALDDFFLEHASGQFILDLVPGRQHPQIILLLTGTAVGDESGVSIRLKVGKFKLKGDKGKGVPSLSFDTIKVTTVLRVTAMLSFDMNRRKWLCDSDNFSIDMLYFRGPFGIRQSLVASVLSLTTPLIRNAILDALPPELGVFVSHLPSPLSVRGEFTITGTELNNFTTRLNKSPEMCSLVGYSPNQMLVFMAIQKSIDRPSGDMIKTMEDLLNYRKIGTTYHREWDEIKNLWNDAIAIYFNKANITDFPPISFEQLLMGTDEILRNPLSIQFALHSCECQVSLRSVLENVIDYFVRWRNNNAGNDELVHVVKKMKQTLISLGSVLGLVTQNLDFADLKVALKLMAGPKGMLHVSCKDIMAQVPLAIIQPLPREIGFGFAAPVPHIFFVRSQSDGEISIEMLHCGSNEMKNRTAYTAWKLRQEQKAAGGDGRNIMSGNAQDEALNVSDMKSTRIMSSTHFTPTDNSAPPSSLQKAFGSLNMDDNPEVERGSSHSAEQELSVLGSHEDIEGDEKDKEDQNELNEEVIDEAPQRPPPKRKSLLPFSRGSKASAKKNDDGQDPPKKRASMITMPSFRKKSVDVNDESCGMTTPPPVISAIKPKRRFSTAAGRALQLSRKPTARGLDGTRIRSDSASETSSVTSNLTKENSVSTDPVRNNYFSRELDRNEDTDDDDLEMIPNGVFITASERERRSLTATMLNRPPPDGVHRMFLLKVQSPHISVIVDQMLKLKPGAELVNVKLGPIDTKWTPFGFESSTPLKSSRDAPTGEKKQTLVNTNVATARFVLHGDEENYEGDSQNDIHDKRYGAYKKESTKQVATVLGCPLLLQTSEHIKALAQIPGVEIDLYIATVLRFLNNFFDDIEVLRRFLGVMDAYMQEEIDEYIFLFKVLVDRLGKYLLLPNLELDVNISAKIVATDEDIILTVQPNVPIAAAGGIERPSLSAMGNSAKDFSSSSGGDNVIQLFAKINVMDVVADYVAVANAMKRCAEFYEQNHGDDEESDDDGSAA